jgi:hypothetical protein
MELINVVIPKSGIFNLSFFGADGNRFKFMDKQMKRRREWKKKKAELRKR